MYTHFVDKGSRLCYSKNGGVACKLAQEVITELRLTMRKKRERQMIEIQFFINLFVDSHVL